MVEIHGRYYGYQFRLFPGIRASGRGFLFAVKQLLNGVAVNKPKNVFNHLFLPLENHVSSGFAHCFEVCRDAYILIEESDLVNLLKPGGRLVISGPTENILYQIGRRLAGPEYSGQYHERGIAEIKRELNRLASVEQIATLYWPVPLFEVFVARV